MLVVPCVAADPSVAEPSRAPAAQATDYVNVRFGFQVSVPAHFIGRGESDNSDGQVFASNDGKAQVRVHGSDVLGASTTCSAKSAFAGESPTFTYTRTLKNVSIASGTFAEQIFYSKVIRTKDTCLTLTMQYPVAQRRLYDPQIASVASSFQETAKVSP